MKQLKDTLNLPSTKFSMKANLAQKEPGLLDYWKNLNLYQLIQEKNKDKPLFNLHDGPPYALSLIHISEPTRR